MPEDDIRPSESSEVYTHDQDTAQRQQRARTAAANYRAHTGWTNPSNFDPAPAAIPDDPQPPSDAADTPPGQSAKVGYYDGLLPNHRTTTATGVTQFGTNLSDYATYYNDHIRKPGEPKYKMPVSQVTPIDVTDDGADRHSESNLVGDYDVKASGYSAISVSSTGTTGTHGTTYAQKMASAIATLEVLESETNADGIKKKFESLKNYYDSLHTSINSSQTDRKKMSVVDAGTKDVTTIKSDIDVKLKDTVMYKGNSGQAGTQSEPKENTISWFGPNIEKRVAEMVNNIKNKLITPAEFNTLCDEMLGYINQSKTYSQWKSARGSNYTDKFSDSIMQACWNCALTRTEEYKAMCDEMLGYINQSKTYSQWKSARGSNYSGKFSDSIMRKCWDNLTDYVNQT